MLYWYDSVALPNMRPLRRRDVGRYGKLDRDVHMTRVGTVIHVGDAPEDVEPDRECDRWAIYRRTDDMEPEYDWQPGKVRFTFECVRCEVDAFMDIAGGFIVEMGRHRHCRSVQPIELHWNMRMAAVRDAVIRILQYVRCREDGNDTSRLSAAIGMLRLPQSTSFMQRCAELTDVELVRTVAKYNLWEPVGCCGEIALLRDMFADMMAGTTT